MVMCGSIFAACEDAPGENLYSYKEVFAKEVCGQHEIVKDKIARKRYHGSASAKQKGKSLHIEGRELEIPCNGMTYEEKYEELFQSLKSAISYGGGNNLDCFRKLNYIVTK